MAEPIDPDEVADRLGRQAARQMSGWFQVDLRARPGKDPMPPALASALATSLQRWQAQDRVDGWFYGRAPGAVRLRLHAPAAAGEGFPAVLESWSGRLVGDGLVAEGRTSRYEPEEYRFGGSVGTVLAHRHFEVDSGAALALVHLRHRDPAVAAVPEPHLAMVLANDLIARVVADGAELWDVWRRLADAVGTPTGDAAVGGNQIPPPDLEGARRSLSGGLETWLPPALHPLVTAAQDANAAVADAVLADPTVPRRAWLSVVTAYDWNRQGLGAADVARMTAGVLAVLDGRDQEP